ncbi:tetratricopeptide repeat protein [Pseudomonas sp. MS19]|uniref:tetratricopeptide repeat protein n=1 Tax=Pseudomonas sp. MS19 TaxID=2579939 RepID=UPI001562ADBF|nr:tetratricopeptide repeat protein [Pseudomonas sp. MS19]NRH29091.1 tetratricopeptide repeat protein [Pseudomonas sp. MS19]
MFSARLISLSWALCALFTQAIHAEPGKAPGLAEHSEGYASAQTCTACHVEETKAWKDSDHAWAMRLATPENVLGDFANAEFTDGKVNARFFKKADKFFVNTEGPDGKPTDFEIRYTFGFSPLQQYLVEMSRGRLQSLTIAWDSRPKAEGGQRWFSLYPGQHFTPDDPLHWTGRYQNWNAMCADCHSTNLLNNYDDKADAFATTWKEQNVGCQSCHGPAQAHVDWAEKAKEEGKPAGEYSALKDIGLQVDYAKLGSQGLVEQCASCHSRRQTLGIDAHVGKPLLDSAVPSTLRENLYHADGQIQGEVYVYGSFTQSKMYNAGVTCTDCHNPHTNKVKIEGNGLCMQCHTETPPKRFPSLQAKNYDTPEHHHHEVGSAGAQCVNCHMPEETYMVIDPRRDHSMRIPRPDLAAQTASPDACTTCHEDQKPEWASKAIEGWFGSPARPPHYGEDFHAARTGQPGSMEKLAAIITDLGKPAIVRATAADEIAAFGAPALPTLEQALKDKNPLVRNYAVSAFTTLPPVERVKRLLPLLDDPLQSVRDETVRALAGIPTIALPEASREPFKAALADYEKRLRSNASLPGNRLNLAVLLEREGRDLEAMDEYRAALKLDPYFTPARVNLVTLANNSLRPDEAEKSLRDGLALPDSPAPDRGNLAYMLALLLVEHGKPEEAVKWFGEAAQGLPGNPRIRYNQGLLLLQLKRVDEAKEALAAGLEQAGEDPDLLYAMIYLHGSTGDRKGAIGYLQRLMTVAPDDPRIEQAKSQLGVKAVRMSDLR